MSWKKLILWLLALTFCLAGALLLWAFHADLGRFQPRIEAALIQLLDREARFDELSIHLGSSIDVRATGFRIANLPGAEPPDFLHIRSLDGAVTLSSLFTDGPLVIERMDADGVHIHLAWDEAGVGNYPVGQATGEPQAESLPDEAPAQAFVSVIHSRISNGSLTLSWPTHENVLEFHQLELADVEDGMIQLAFDGAINDNPMDFTGRAGPRVALRDAGAVTIEGQGSFAGLRVAGTADIDSLAEPHRPIVQLDVEGDDIREIEALLGLEPGPQGTYQLLLDSTVQGDTWAVDVRGHIGEVVFDANGDAAGLRDLSRVGLNVYSKGPDLGNVLRLFRVNEFRQEPFEIRGRILRDGPVLELREVDMDLGSTRFDLNGSLSDFPHLRGASVELEVQGDDIESFRDLLGLPGTADGPFSLDLTFDPGAGTVTDTGAYDRVTAQVVTNLGTIGLRGDVSPAENYAGTTLAVDLDGQDAAASVSPLGLPGLESAPYEADAELEIQDDGLYFQSLRVTGLYGLSARAQGLVGWDPLDGVTRLDIDIDGEDLAGTLRPLGVEWPLASSAFTLSTGLRATGSGLRLDNLVLDVDRSRLQADALIPLEADLAGLDITLQAEGPELTNLFQSGESLEVPPGAWAVTSHLRRVDGRLLLENTQIGLADVSLSGEASLPWPLEAGTGSFVVQGEGPDVTFLLPRLGKFRFAAQPFSLNAEAEVVQGTWQLKPSSLRLGEASLQVSGTADRLPDYSDTALALKATIPDLGALGTWRDEALENASFSIETRLAGTRNRLVAEPLTLTTDASSAEGRLTWDTAGPVPLLEVAMSSEELDLRPVLPEPEPPDPDGPADDSEPAGSPDERLIPDTPLRLDWLDDLNARVDLDAGRVIMHERLMNDLAVDLQLQDGLLTLERYRVRGRLGEFDIAGKLFRREDGKAAVTLDFNALDLLPAREDWLNADPATLPRVNAIMEAEAVGATPRELAATLNGRLRGVASEGVLPGKGLGALNTYFIQQILSVLVPGLTAQEPTTLKCFAANVMIRDGKVTPEPMVVLRTDKLLIQVAGSINLENERLSLQFQTTPSKLLGASLMELTNPFVSIEGTLANPTPIIDPGRTIVYGGAAAATAGLSIVAKGLWDRLRGAQRPCEQLRSALEEEGQLDYGVD